MRYLLFKEETCPICEGEGWVLRDNYDVCLICEGEGRKYTQVAILPEDEGEVLVVRFGEKDLCT